MTKKTIKLTIAHINDTHSYFDPSSVYLQLPIENKEPVHAYVSCGGFSRIASRVKQLKAKAVHNDTEFLFLHAGDCFQGTLYYSLYKGLANADLLNEIGIDAMVLGNHELDMGNEPVADFVQNIDFPLLAGNWDLSNESKDKEKRLSDSPNLLSYNPKLKTAAYLTKWVDGERIAIFGLSIDKMADIANPDFDTPFVNALKTARNTVAMLHDEGINNIILLSHLGYEGDLELARQTDGIGLIIGGHSHVLQGDFSNLGFSQQDNYGVEINGTRVVQAGCHALAMGHMEIEFDTDGNVVSFEGANELLFGQRLCLDAIRTTELEEDLYQQAREYLIAQPNVHFCKKDERVEKLMNERYRPEVEALQNTEIGMVQSSLRHVRIPDEKGGSEVAPLVTCSFLWKANQEGFDADFSLHNAGGVRASIPEGSVSSADIAGKVLPFAVPVSVYDIKGKYLALAIESAIDNATNNGVVGTGSGSFPYSAGLRYEYDANQKSGSRLTYIQIQSEAGEWFDLQPEQVYRGVSSAYTIKGKEGYSALLNVESEPVITSFSMADCFNDYIVEQKGLSKLEVNVNRYIAGVTKASVA